MAEQRDSDQGTTAAAAAEEEVVENAQKATPQGTEGTGSTQQRF